MAGEYAPVCSRHSVLQRRSDRPNGETPKTARLAAGARHRDGCVVHPATHCVLRGQWSESASVALDATSGTLAPPEPRRVPDSGLVAATPSTHSECTRSSEPSVNTIAVDPYSKIPKDE